MNEPRLQGQDKDIVRNKFTREFARAVAEGSAKAARLNENVYILRTPSRGGFKYFFLRQGEVEVQPTDRRQYLGRVTPGGLLVFPED